MTVMKVCLLPVQQILCTNATIFKYDEKCFQMIINEAEEAIADSRGQPME